MRSSSVTAAGGDRFEQPDDRRGTAAQCSAIGEVRGVAPARSCCKRSAEMGDGCSMEMFKRFASRWKR